MKKDYQDYRHFVEVVGCEIQKVLNNLDYEALRKAADLIEEARKNGNRMHISGIGKPAHLANYLVSLMSSTGTPAYYLHGTEAVHGSGGQLVPGDVVMFISNSGETAEMKVCVRAVKNNGCKIIGVSGNPDSWLAREADMHLLAHVDEEGGPLNRAPRTSILAETVTVQALSVLLQSDADVTSQQYVKWHPSGTLGVLREDEK